MTMNKKLFLMGMAACALAFGLVLAGCGGGDDGGDEPIEYNVIKAVTSEGNAKNQVTTITYDGIKIARDEDYKDVPRLDIAFTDIQAKLAAWEFIPAKYEVQVTGTTDTANATGVEFAFVNKSNGNGGYSGPAPIEAVGAFDIKRWPGNAEQNAAAGIDTLQIRWKYADDASIPEVSDAIIATWTNVTITLKPIDD